jgi:hypothetical protein
MENYLAELRSYADEHLATVASDGHSYIIAFIDWVEGKKAAAEAEAAKIAAEIEHLIAAGYTVVKTGV